MFPLFPLCKFSLFNNTCVGFNLSGSLWLYAVISKMIILQVSKAKIVSWLVNSKVVSTEPISILQCSISSIWLSITMLDVCLYFHFIGSAKHFSLLNSILHVLVKFISHGISFAYPLITKLSQISFMIWSLNQIENDWPQIYVVFSILITHWGQKYGTCLKWWINLVLQRSGCFSQSATELLWNQNVIIEEYFKMLLCSFFV